MPLYEYRCSSCSATFEQLRRMQDADAAVVCPKCQSAGAERLLSTFASHTASSAETAAPCGAPGSACGSGRAMSPCLLRCARATSSTYCQVRLRASPLARLVSTGSSRASSRSCVRRSG
ncbi:MAG: zinc ribbon domain-containing protein [Bryobacteraceae bacterium]